MAMRAVAPGMLAWSVMGSPWSPPEYQTARTRAAAGTVHVGPAAAGAVQEPAGRFLPAGRGPCGGRVDFLGVAPAFAADFFGVALTAAFVAGDFFVVGAFFVAGAFLVAAAGLAVLLRVAGFLAGFLATAGSGAGSAAAAASTAASAAAAAMAADEATVTGPAAVSTVAAAVAAASAAGALASAVTGGASRRRRRREPWPPASPPAWPRRAASRSPLPWL